MRKEDVTKRKERFRSIPANQMKTLLARTLHKIRGIEPETARVRLYCRRIYRVDRILFASQLGMSWHECRENMIRLLQRKVPKEKLRDVLRLLKLEGPEWTDMHHFGLGIYVRNLLRRGGFNYWRLDDVWQEVVEEAARRSVAAERAAAKKGRRSRHEQ